MKTPMSIFKMMFGGRQLRHGGGPGQVSPTPDATWRDAVIVSEQARLDGGCRTFRAPATCLVWPAMFDM